jgi:hypothetical protein
METRVRTGLLSAARGISGPLCAALLILFSPGAFAQVLWQEYAAGMSAAQVQALAKDAVAVDDPKAVLPSGAQTKLKIPSMEVAGLAFEVNFMFMGDKLSDVQLFHRADQNSSAGRASYSQLLSALRAKYGHELIRDGSESPIFGWNGSNTWSAGGTTIRLLGFIGPSSTTVVIGYSARLAKDAEKL